MKKTYMYAGVALLGFGMFLGGIVSSIIFFGLISAASLIMLVESSRAFKMFAGRFGFLIDLILFILSALAVSVLGVTIAGGLGVASLLFTVYRINFLAPWYAKAKDTGRSLFSYVAEGINSVVDSIKSLFTTKTITNV